MKSFYFPPELWTIIYQYDNTYKIVYDNCMQEMISYFNHNKINCIMKARFYYYTLYLINSQDVIKMPCINYITITNSRESLPYKDLNAVVHNRNCWQHFIKSPKGKIYTKLK
jgi:hypothetical protein